MEEDINKLIAEIQQEQLLQKENMDRQWAKPLHERITSARALGPLTIHRVDEGKQLILFIPPKEDFAIFSEFQVIQLSQDNPQVNGAQVRFIGLVDGYLAVSCKNPSEFLSISRTGWCLDETFVDLSHFYLQALKSLPESAHGRDNVYPTLFEERESEVEAERYENLLDDFEAKGSQLNDSQADAIATAVASTPFHLVQGPPGTGKTYVLAETVKQLVYEGKKILISGFTHRSIHNALNKIYDLLGELCPVVKISPSYTISNSLKAPNYETLSDSKLDLHAGPYVIGATPFTLYSRRLRGHHFDAALVDETSQVTTSAAIMVMLHSDQWIFFGDDCQLPPVSLIHQNDPKKASAFGRLRKQCHPSTLTKTYRLNEDLTKWPSDNFYYSELESVYPNARFKTSSIINDPWLSLQEEPSLITILVNDLKSRACNNEEADIAAELILSLHSAQFDMSEVGIVTPFRSQSSKIRQLLQGMRFTPHQKQTNKSISIDTVDRFQGQEREIMIYSFCSSDRNFIQQIQNFIFQQERLNVAVTRAKTKMILLVSKGLISYAKSHQTTDESCALFLDLIHHSHLTTDHG